MHIKVLGIDLAKNGFQLCAINQAGKERFNRAVRRIALSGTPVTFWEMHAYTQ